MKCSACTEEDNFDKTFLKEGKWMGTTPRPLEHFRKDEFSLGWDYYPKHDVLQLTCKECGYVDYIKAGTYDTVITE